MQARVLGTTGEEIATEYLKRKGFEILQRNFTVRGGEIDIVARHRDILIFVEVKTRTGRTFGEADESVDSTKKHRIHRAIGRYIHENAAQKDPDYRIDLLEIHLDPATKKLESITHFEDIE